MRTNQDTAKDQDDHLGNAQPGSAAQTTGVSAAISVTISSVSRPLASIAAIAQPSPMALAHRSHNHGALLPVPWSQQEST
jgi:hypothetical protein